VTTDGLEAADYRHDEWVTSGSIETPVFKDFATKADLDKLTATVDDLRDGLVTVSQQLAFAIEQELVTQNAVNQILQLLGAVQQMAMNMGGVKGAAIRAVAGKFMNGEKE
jgi:hypothetical protein